MGKEQNNRATRGRRRRVEKYNFLEIFRPLKSNIKDMTLTVLGESCFLKRILLLQFLFPSICWGSIMGQQLISSKHLIREENDTLRLFFFRKQISLSRFLGSVNIRMSPVRNKCSHEKCVSVRLAFISRGELLTTSENLLHLPLEMSYFCLPDSPTSARNSLQRSAPVLSAFFLFPQKIKYKNTRTG